MTVGRRHWLGVVLLALATGHGPRTTVHAHPVPRQNHDRTIEVRLTAEAVVVHYRLEVDPWTVVYSDLPAVSDQVDLAKLRRPTDFYDAFTRVYGPILADNFVARMDDAPLAFQCVKHRHEVLDHLRCDFVFEAPWRPAPGRRHRFTFQETNYEYEEGRVALSLGADAGLRLTDRVAPDAALLARSPLELRPGDTAQLRRVTATVEIQPEATTEPTDPPPSPPAAAPRHDLLVDLLDSERGFWVLMVLAAAFGAAHALTPGHGKTLVASYLVGEQGTIWHALLLGVVTTLTHTGVVLALAAVLPWLFPGAVPADVQAALGIFGGLLIAGIGFWLLLRRLTGGADHFHFGSHGHRHHHHAPPLAPGQKLSAWGLVGLGISGGLVPCWDAILMLGLAISAQRLWLGLPLLLAFSAGLSGVLVLIGMAVVTVKGFAGSHFGESRLFRALPILSAVAVTGLGLWLCYDSLHPSQRRDRQGNHRDGTTAAVRVAVLSGRQSISGHDRRGDIHTRPGPIAPYANGPGRSRMVGAFRTHRSWPTPWKYQSP